MSGKAEHGGKGPANPDTGDTAEELAKELGQEHRTLGRDGEAGDATSPNAGAQRDADDEHSDTD
jgi:hypothetical protein